MPRASDLRKDYDALLGKLPEADGSEAAAIARERRLISADLPDVDRLADLAADYSTLGEMLGKSEGSGAAAIVRERRMIAAAIEALEVPEVTSLVDELAAKRAEAGAVRPAARRRQSR